MIELLLTIIIVILLGAFFPWLLLIITFIPCVIFFLSSKEDKLIKQERNRVENDQKKVRLERLKLWYEEVTDHLADNFEEGSFWSGTGGLALIKGFEIEKDWSSAIQCSWEPTHQPKKNFPRWPSPQFEKYEPFKVEDLWTLKHNKPVLKLTLVHLIYNEMRVMSRVDEACSMFKGTFKISDISLEEELGSIDDVHNYLKGDDVHNYLKACTQLNRTLSSYGCFGFKGFISMSDDELLDYLWKYKESCLREGFRKTPNFYNGVDFDSRSNLDLNCEMLQDWTYCAHENLHYFGISNLFRAKIDRVYSVYADILPRIPV